MPNKLTDAEVKKALECCHGQMEADCINCPNEKTCGEIDVVKSVIDLINRQEGVNEKNENIIRIADKTIATLSAENESLKAEVERLQETIKVLRVSVEQAPLIRKDGKSPLSLLTAEIKAEAYKEFAELVHCHCESIINQEWNKKVSPVSWADAYKEFDEYIDNLLNELVGEDNSTNIDKQN